MYTKILLWLIFQYNYFNYFIFIHSSCYCKDFSFRFIVNCYLECNILIVGPHQLLAANFIDLLIK